jgi:hypothetical protein
MKNRKLLLVCLLLWAGALNAQIDEDQMGAWYMVFWQWDFKEGRFGLQGDYQFRNWNLGGDLEQLLLRNGVTYRPKDADIKFTVGYVRVETGTFGESRDFFVENRYHQEAMFPQKLGGRFFLNHRFRHEFRKLEDQDWRTRFRYFLGMNVPVNQTDLKQGAYYVAFYNEIFINGQRDIGHGREVEIFDRNRVYLGVGHSFTDKSRMQLGWMRQSTFAWSKNQWQVGWHQWF